MWGTPQTHHFPHATPVAPAVHCRQALVRRPCELPLLAPGPLHGGGHPLLCLRPILEQVGPFAKLCPGSHHEIAAAPVAPLALAPSVQLIGVELLEELRGELVFSVEQGSPRWALRAILRALAWLETAQRMVKVESMSDMEYLNEY